MLEVDELARLSLGFRRFADLEAGRSSPLYALPARELAERPEFLGLLEAAEPTQRRPNLLFAAVHNVLLGGVDHDLAAYYPSLGGGRAPEAEAFTAFVAFLDQHRGRVMERLRERRTQTNEVRRAALLRPVLHRIAREIRGSLVLVEVGAAGGLLLLVDRYAYDYGEDRIASDIDDLVIYCQQLGSIPLPTEPPFTIGTRLGIDLNPLDPADPDDARWLKACIWPEHTERRRLLERALDVAAEQPQPVLEGEALDLLPRVIDELPPDEHVLIRRTRTSSGGFDPKYRANPPPRCRGSGGQDDDLLVCGSSCF